MTNTEEMVILEAVINKSDLSDDDKNRWKVFLGSAPDWVQGDFVDLFEEKPEMLQWLNQNWKDKEEFAKTGRPWSDFWLKEAESLENFLK
ncbi:MAG: hypothetical protein KGZ30_03700 [Anaplasmataceae bacterium]|nr:hypothetical protein [Anaplasmataceae bacterium]